MRRIEDWLLALLQRRCNHPGDMVAADIHEGCTPGIETKWCRRCGAIKTDWNAEKSAESNHRYITLEHWWRRPDPNLWRG